MRIIARSQLLSLFTFLIIFITFSIMLYGCASTTPNISIVDENFRFDCEANDNLHKVKDILAEISLKNKLLSIELGKLPEFQDCIIIKEKLGLDNIYNFYNDNCSILDEAFAKMYEVGKPETRRYCTPLQALFWLAEDGELSNSKDLLSNYSLTSLLDKAWNFSIVIPEDKIRQIIDGIKIEDTKKIYLKYLESGNISQIQTSIARAYQINHQMFSYKASGIIAQLKEENPRWGDFDVVIERLNAPELVDYYEKKQIIWADWRSLPQWPVSSRYVFKFGKGDCTAIAYFTALCLTTGGYNAYEYQVKARRSVDSHHSICVFEINGEKFIMDNGTPRPRGIMPYGDFM